MFGNVMDFIILGIIIGLVFFGIPMLKSIWEIVKEALKALER